MDVAFTGDVHQVAAEAAVEIIRYAHTNPDGADLIAPSDVRAIVAHSYSFLMGWLRKENGIKKR